MSKQCVPHWAHLIRKLSRTNVSQVQQRKKEKQHKKHPENAVVFSRLSECPPQRPDDPAPAAAPLPRCVDSRTLAGSRSGQHLGAKNLQCSPAADRHQDRRECAHQVRQHTKGFRTPGSSARETEHRYGMVKTKKRPSCAILAVRARPKHLARCQSHYTLVNCTHKAEIAPSTDNKITTTTYIPYLASPNTSVRCDLPRTPASLPTARRATPSRH